MVFVTRSFSEKLKKPIRNYLRSGFRDSLRIFVAGGAGGNGLPKFGGVGGKGGNVIVEAKEGIDLESVFKFNKMKRYLAASGKHATHNFILGPPGEDIKFDVPVGVTIFTELGKKLGELNQEGEKLILAKGGSGGNAKNGFLGTRGQSYSVKLDLKLIADVGLVGFPNAGKSTLLRAISQAKPRIASYPFTTIRPHLGIIIYKDLRQISMADLPGLIEGAHANKGMGHQFLKHIERTKLVVMIADINGFRLSPEYPHRSCLETIMLLRKELELYNEDLLKKPSLLLINKMDTEGADKNFLEIKHSLKNFEDYLKTFPDEIKPKSIMKFSDIIPISAKEKEDDINFVKNRIRHLLDLTSEMQEQEDLSADLYGDIKKSIRERGPTLV